MIGVDLEITHSVCMVPKNLKLTKPTVQKQSSGGSGIPQVSAVTSVASAEKRFFKNTTAGPIIVADRTFPGGMIKIGKYFDKKKLTEEELKSPYLKAYLDIGYLIEVSSEEVNFSEDSSIIGDVKERKLGQSAGHLDSGKKIRAKMESRTPEEIVADFQKQSESGTSEEIIISDTRSLGETGLSGILENIDGADGDKSMDWSELKSVLGE